MSKFHKLIVHNRNLVGRKVKQLRRQGFIPANLFGHNIDSISIQVDAAKFSKVYNEVGETSIIELSLNDKAYPCLVKGIAIEPVTGSYLHVDFHNVSLKEKVTATIPLEVTGESAAVKELGGVVNQSLHELEVEALPTDLPENIIVDITSLAAIGDSIAIKDLSIPSEVAVSLDPETIVISVAEPAPEEVVEEPTPAEAAPVTEAPAEETTS